MLRLRSRAMSSRAFEAQSPAPALRQSAGGPGRAAEAGLVGDLAIDVAEQRLGLLQRLLQPGGQFAGQVGHGVGRRPRGGHVEVLSRPRRGGQRLGPARTSGRWRGGRRRCSRTRSAAGTGRRRRRRASSRECGAARGGAPRGGSSVGLRAESRNSALWHDSRATGAAGRSRAASASSSRASPWLLPCTTIETFHVPGPCGTFTSSPRRGGARPSRQGTAGPARPRWPRTGSSVT